MGMKMKGVYRKRVAWCVEARLISEGGMCKVSGGEGLRLDPWPMGGSSRIPFKNQHFSPP